MRVGSIAAVTIVAAVLGGGAALGIGKGAGWLDQGTKTVVVKAQASGPAALPASASSNVPALAGKDFDPQRIFAQRSPGVVTIFAYFGDPSSQDAQVAQGSGFVISSRGYVLTNSHVVTNAGESSRVQVGQPVAAIGSPLGNENSLTVGVVSAIHRSIDAITVRKYKVVDAIQTDASITHGNSGGPLLDARGRVIGINAQIRSESGNGNDSGIGFAIPIDAAKHSVSQLIAKGRVTYAYVGITTDNMTPSLAHALGYKVEHGALIIDVNDGSPALAAHLRGGTREVDVLGIQALKVGGDVIVEIDGQPVESADDVVRIVSFSLKPNDVAVFTVVRNGQRKKIPVRLAERRVPTG